jgi:glycerate kinase
VAKVAKKHNNPVIAIAGYLGFDSDTVKEQGIDACFSIVPGVVELETALNNAREYVVRCTENAGVVLKIGMGVRCDTHHRIISMD